MIRLVTLATGFLLIASPASGQTTRYVATDGEDLGDCTVEANPCATISYAVSRAGNGDTIDIADGEYTESFEIDKDLSLHGESEAGTILQAHESPGEADSRVITISGEFEVEITDLMIRHGVVVDGAGGGLYSEDATLTLTNVTFRENTARFGGGMSDQHGDLVLENVTFSDNTAVEQSLDGGIGGGMYNFDNSVSLTNVVFVENHAEDQGGGMHNQINTAALEHVTFTQNTADGYGGAMNNWAATLTLSDVTIYGSYAPWGAGMYNLGSSSRLFLTDVTFTKNGGGGYGGGMYNNNAGDIELTDVTFTGNVVGFSGGGVYNESTSPTLVNVHFIQNSAGLQGGGGMYNDEASSPSLTGGTFTGNVAHSASGGGLFNAGDFTSLADVTFEENSAGGSNGSGGGMENQGHSVTFVNVTFSENTARAGGGLRNTGSAPTLAGVTFESNHANSGGGMYSATNTSPELVNVTFTGNTAMSGTVGSGGGFGGGMYNTGSSPTLSDVTFSGNMAEDGGGGMINVGGSPQLASVTFDGNSTTGSPLHSGGGGMQNSGSSPVLVDIEFIDNVSAGIGGGMYNVNGSASALTDVTFSGNVAAGNSGGGIGSNTASSLSIKNGVFIGNSAELAGGGMWITGDSEITLVNVELFGNEAGDGGGMHVRESSLMAINTTVSGNSASNSGGGLRTEVGGSVTAHNTVFWDNMAGGSGNEINTGPSSGSVQLSYSLYRNGPGDIGGSGSFQAESSLTEDPLFVDAENGDLRLMEGSPAIDTGDPETDLVLFPVNDDGDPIDLDGNLRVFGDDIDIGVYEHQGTISDEASPQEIAEILSTPSPNPARSTATFTLAVEQGQNVSVEIFDLTGRRVQTLYDGTLAAGMSETLTLDASLLPAGVYLIRATGEDFAKTRRVTVVK